MQNRHFGIFLEHFAFFGPAHILFLPFFAVCRGEIWGRREEKESVDMGTGHKKEEGFHYFTYFITWPRMKGNIHLEHVFSWQMARMQMESQIHEVHLRLLLTACLLTLYGSRELYGQVHYQECKAVYSAQNGKGRGYLLNNNLYIPPVLE